MPQLAGLGLEECFWTLRRLRGYANIVDACKSKKSVAHTAGDGEVLKPWRLLGGEELWKWTMLGRQRLKGKPGEANEPRGGAFRREAAAQGARYPPGKVGKNWGR